jgi:lipopolysaccharide/colanic/teichoic acid biosynthesis glycosyltransferase
LFLLIDGATKSAKRQPFNWLLDLIVICRFFVSSYFVNGKVLMSTDQFSDLEYFDSTRVIGHNELSSKMNAALKRGFDILVSILGLLFLSPLFLMIAILVKRDSPGPVFYRGPRLGRGGKPFGILKFRTMVEAPESYNGSRITPSNDTRITSLGSWLRNTKINELPQLWNVLKGEMSLVGPRPEDPEIAMAWPEEARCIILSLRPGITCPASISYHDEEKKLIGESFIEEYIDVIMPDKLRLDCIYVRHHTFLTDLDAIFWTLIVLVPRVERKPMPEGALFGGPFSHIMRTYVNWFTIDFVIAFIGVALVGGGWRAFSPLDIGIQNALAAAALLALLFGSVNAALGLKRVVWSRAAAEDVLGLFVSCAIVASISMVMEFIFHWPKFPNGFLAIASLVVLFGFVVARYRFRLITGLASRWANWRGTGYGTGERVMIVGAGKGGEFATWLLRRQDFQRMFSIVGYIDDDPGKQGMRIDGLQVLGTTADIPALAKQHDIGVIFYAIGRETSADERRIIRLCKETGAHFVSVGDVLGTLRNQLSKPAQPRQSQIDKL